MLRGSSFALRDKGITRSSPCLALGEKLMPRCAVMHQNQTVEATLRCGKDEVQCMSSESSNVKSARNTSEPEVSWW